MAGFKMESLSEDPSQEGIFHLCIHLQLEHSTFKSKLSQNTKEDWWVLFEKTWTW